MARTYSHAHQSANRIERRLERSARGAIRAKAERVDARSHGLYTSTSRRGLPMDYYR